MPYEKQRRQQQQQHHPKRWRSDPKTRKIHFPSIEEWRVLLLQRCDGWKIRFAVSHRRQFAIRYFILFYFVFNYGMCSLALDIGPGAGEWQHRIAMGFILRIPVSFLSYIADIHAFRIYANNMVTVRTYGARTAADGSLLFRMQNRCSMCQRCLSL